jgi:predicted DNA-binding transcriptional regulator YafY
MYHPTSRLLTILNLLQSHKEMTGQELARRLEVDPRTIRRSITVLQDMGIPIEAERGRTGAYFLRSGYTLPPLMFNAEEAFAVALSLRLAEQTALFGAGVILEGASAKIQRVLPADIQQQVQSIVDTLSLETNLVTTVETSAQVILSVTKACYQHQRVHLKHQAYGGHVIEREIDPYGVAYRVGRWYVVGYCHLRQALRTFRLDRILTVDILEATFEPATVNIIDYVEHALAMTPGLFYVEVIFDTDLHTLRTYIPASLGQLVELSLGQTQLSCYVQSLGWMAGCLSGIPLSFKVTQPESLNHELEAIITRLKRNLCIDNE